MGRSNSFEMRVKNLLQNESPSKFGKQSGSETYGSSPRIYLSRIGMYGLVDMHEYSVIPKFFDHLEFREDKSIEDTTRYLEKLLGREASGNTAYWFIRLLDSDKVIGTLGLIDIDFDKKTGEIGKGLSPDYWGKGYMNEAFSLYLAYCFDILGLEKLWSVTSHENEANIRLMKRCGFTVERRLENFYRKHDGRQYDAVLLEQLKGTYLNSRLDPK